MATDPDDVDGETPSAARAYDYFLGGAHNFGADRAFAEQVRALVPWVGNVARLNRSFLRRVVDYCLDAGIDQFLDLGSGIPTVGNVHEIAQARHSEARVVYVDSEPVAYHTASAMLADNPRASIIQADLRDPEAVLSHPVTRELIDFSRPLGLLMVGVLLFVGPEDHPDRLISTYRERMAPGGYLAVSHLADEHAGPELREQVGTLIGSYAQAGEHVYSRTGDELATWLDGMDLVEPGITYLPDWRPDDSREQSDVARPLGYGALARQP